MNDSVFVVLSNGFYYCDLPVRRVQRTELNGDGEATRIFCRARTKCSCAVCHGPLPLNTFSEKDVAGG